MLQRLPIAFAQVKADNIIKVHLLNDNLEVIYSLYQAKRITKKKHSNIMNSLELKCQMDIKFMNFENSKTLKPYRLLISLSDKIKLKRSDKYVALSNGNTHYTRKIKQSYAKTINLKYHF